MAEKIPASRNRLLKGIFVCKRCATKIRSDMLKVMSGKIKCRRCNSRTFRPKSRKK